MAEYGSHHATTGSQRPSIFEVLGHENLMSGLKAAFRQLFRFLSENYPEHCGYFYKYFDESYVLVDSVFQYLHLRLKGGLFTETFYGLKRLPDPRNPEVSKAEVITWVVLYVILPYARSQLEELFKTLREKHAEGLLQYKGIRQKLALLYLKLYPIFHSLWEFVILCYYMGYALKKTDFHSPLLHVTSTKLVPCAVEDQHSDSWKQYIPNDKQRKLSTLIWNLINSFVGGVTLTISCGAFCMQFLEWWYSQETGTVTFGALPVPPPPSKWPLEINEGICPICKKEMYNDTALSSSGFVFCYPCIFQYVKENEKCPVTGYRSSLGQLVKLYNDESRESYD